MTLAAVVSLSTGSSRRRWSLGALILLGAAILAEAYPVPVEGVSAGGVSLAASFLVGSALIYDWETATILGFLTRAVIEIVQRRPLSRLAYNSSTYALASATAGWLVHVVGPDGRRRDDSSQRSALASLGFYAVNVTLVGLVVARASGARFDDILVQSVRWTAVPFAIMGSLSVILAVLWESSHYLLGALVGPLVAVALYQRSVQGELEALRLAKTDPLTGLGNHRAFHERLREVIRELDEEPVSLALHRYRRVQARQRPARPSCRRQAPLGACADSCPRPAMPTGSEATSSRSSSRPPRRKRPTARAPGRERRGAQGAGHRLGDDLCRCRRTSARCAR